MSAFDDLWNIPNSITADRMFFDKKIPMTRECALQIIRAEERWGKGTMRAELLKEAKQALLNPSCDDYALVERGEFGEK